MDTIVVLDDHRPTRDLLCDWLAEHGARAVGAGDLDDLQLALEAHEVAVVLVDLCLPGTPGEEVAAALLRLPEDLRPRVVLFSGIANERLAEVAARVGAHAYVEKSARPERVVAIALAELRARVSERSDGSVLASDGGPRRGPRSPEVPPAPEPELVSAPPLATGPPRASAPTLPQARPSRARPSPAPPSQAAHELGLRASSPAWQRRPRPPRVESLARAARARIARALLPASTPPCPPSPGPW